MDRVPRLKVRQDLNHQFTEDKGVDMASTPADPDNLNTLYDYSADQSSAPRGRVIFRNVTFAYPLRGTTPVLHSVSLEIRPGERTAIVGGKAGRNSQKGTSEFDRKLSHLFVFTKL